MDKYKRWIEDEGTDADPNYEEPTVNKPDIKELLEKAKKAMADDKGMMNTQAYFDYVDTLSPGKMIALLEYVQGLEKIIEDHKVAPRKIWEDFINAVEKDSGIKQCNLLGAVEKHRVIFMQSYTQEAGEKAND